MQTFPTNLFQAQPKLQPAFQLGTLPHETPCLSVINSTFCLRRVVSNCIPEIFCFIFMVVFFLFTFIRFKEHNKHPFLFHVLEIFYALGVELPSLKEILV